MDNGKKCCLGIIIIFLIVAIFLFWPQPQIPLKTGIECDGYSADENGTGYIDIDCWYWEQGDDENETDLENATVEVEVTYENNTTVKHTVTTNYFGDAKIEMPPGNYSVSARIIGNESYENSTFAGYVYIAEYTPPATYEDSQSEYESSTTTGTTTYTRYYWVYV